VTTPGLSRYYKARKLRLKKIKVQKRDPIQDWACYNQIFATAQEAIKWAKKYGFRVVFIDETYFSSLTYFERTFNNVNKHHFIQSNKRCMARVACTMAVFAEFGVEAHCLTTDKMNG
jgi:hypothetical protein